MHLPLLHISNREPLELTPESDPLNLGQMEGRDWFPWLADRDEAIRRARFRTPALDVSALSLAAIGSEVTYFSLLGALFSGYNRETALELAGVILPTVALNQFVKAHLRFPRPPKEAQHPWAFVAPGDYTFPSGHAQNSVALGTFVAVKARKLWVRALGVTLATTIPLSRVYLGVHYPRDVVVASILGASTVIATGKIEQPFKEWWAKQPRGPRGFTFLFASLILGLITGSSLASYPLGVAGGLAVGFDLSGKSRFDLDKPTPKQRTMQILVGTGTVFGVGLAARPLLKRDTPATGALAGVLTGVALTYGIPITTNLVKRIQHWRKKRREERLKQRKRSR